ncbi:MAG: isocitrate lyase/PEP mutase family protein [Thermoleophilia bacterium]
MSDAQRIRDKLAAGKTIVMPGVFDALSARLAADVGFPVRFISGFAVSAARLGMPDLGYLTQTEIAQTTREVCAAGDGPVIVDADTGYGNPLTAIRTARELHAAGAAGIFLEDQEWPKRCGHLDGKRVVPMGQWLAKLRAVRDLAHDGVDLFLVARTDARAAVSFDDALQRARAALNVGVDAIFVEAPGSEDELKRIADATPGAVRVANMVEGGRTPLLSPERLHELGFDLIVSPLTGLFAATTAVRRAYEQLRKHGPARDANGDVAFEEFGHLIGLPHHVGLERRYMD